MDGKRFDAFSKSVAAPATRRTALGSVVASGLMAAFGLKQVPAAAQEAICVIDFTATVRQGPNANQAAGAVRGELSFGLSGKGDLENASLRLADGTSVPVVGQATGHSLQLRIQLAEQQPLVAIGVGEQEIAACQGAIDGVLSGPTAGDLGDWHATVLRSSGAVGGAGGDGEKDKKDKKKEQQAGAGEAGGAASGGASSGGSGGGKPDKKEKKNAGAGGANAGGTQAPATNSGGSQAPATGGNAAGGQCAAGLTQCGDVCVDLTSDLNHCGACGSVCESGLVAVECRNGVCERANCAAGQEFCGAFDGCRDLTSDAEHCGACGTSCGGGSCVNGACQTTQPQPVTCDQGLTDCGGACVNTATDPTNCGVCGNACPTGNECVNAVCMAPVAPPADTCAAQGLTDCAGICVDISSDVANCGACGAVCVAGESCVGGVCQAAGAAAQAAVCAAGETDCGGVCVDLMSDFGNCGACGVACVAPQGCSGGQCVDQTAPPPTNCAAIGPTFIDCGGVCVDAQIDAFNCGGCGVTCQNQCAAGVCV